MTDYGRGTYAAQQRWAKAHDLAAKLWAAGVTAAQQDLWSDDEWARVSRRLIDRPASDRTRALVHALLVTKEAWADAHPDRDDARRRLATGDEVRALAEPRRRR